MNHSVFCNVLALCFNVVGSKKRFVFFFSGEIFLELVLGWRGGGVTSSWSWRECFSPSPKPGTQGQYSEIGLLEGEIPAGLG